MSCRSRRWACAVRWMACRDVEVIYLKGLRVQQRFARFQAQERREGAEHGAQDHPNGDSELPKDGAAAPNRCAGHPNQHAGRPNRCAGRPNRCAGCPNRHAENGTREPYCTVLVAQTPLERVAACSFVFFRSFYKALIKVVGPRCCSPFTRIGWSSSASAGRTTRSCAAETCWGCVTRRRS